MMKRTILFCLVLSVTSLLGQVKTVYIDPSATGNGSGTIENPLDGSTFKVQYGQPWEDSTIYLFKRGTVFNQPYAFALTVSGKSSNITFDAYGEGAKPIIKGTGTSGACINVGGTAILPANITIKNLELDNNKAETYLGGCGVAIANRNGFVTVLNCTIHGVFQGVRVTACPLMSLSVDSCKIYDTWSDGGYFQGGSGVSLHKFVAGWDTIYDVNTSMPNYPNDGDGWHIIDADSVWVHHNYIDHSSSGVKFCLIYNQVNLQTNAYVLLEYNHYKYNNWSTHTYLTLKKGSTYISRYSWYENARLAFQSRGYDEQFYYNKYTNCTKIFELNNTTNSSIVFHNNVIYHTDTVFYGYGPTINFQNNIVDVVSHHLYNNFGQTPSHFNSDYNCYLGIADKGVVTYGAHDILTNPLFTDTATLDFTLKNNSPCIDAGTNMYGNGFDYDGREVPFGLNADIGAYEFIPSTTTPTLTVNPTSLSFGNIIINTTSGEQTYTVQGSNLSPASDSLTITAPSGFTISTVSGSGFASSKKIAYTSGTLQPIPKIIYVRFSPTVEQSYTGSITNDGGGASVQIVSVSGNGSVSTPSITTDSTSLSFGSVMINTVSSEKTYILSGMNLSPANGNSTVMAPTGFQVSTTSGIGFDSSLTVAYSGGILATTTIYVRFFPTVLQSYTGSIIHTGGGAETESVYVSGSGISTSNVDESGMSEIFQLGQNYPNPFNPNTTIVYHLPSVNHVSLKVFDALGKEVATLVNEVQQPGNKSVRFDAITLASGIYFYRLQAGLYTQTKKLVFLR
jgi:hypothetical protein